MKTAFVHDFLTSYTGAERVLKVLTDMYPGAPIYTLLYDEATMGAVFPPERVITSSLQRLPTWIRSRRRFLVSRMPVAIESFDLSAYDLVISSSGAWSKGVLTKPETKHICYAHAPMRFAWDWHAEYAREHHLTGIKGFIAHRIMHSVRTWDYISSTRVDHWIANSHTTAARLQKYYGVTSTVIHPPIDISRFSTQQPMPYPRDAAPYFVIVSRLEPYKRIDLAIEAMQQFPDNTLVIIGTGSDEARLRAMGGANVRFLGYQPDDVVTSYMQHARLFVFPGEDDFGIAPVEASACGVPVVAFARGGAGETVIPQQTGILFTEPTTLSLSRAIEDALRHTWDPHRIREHARTFDTSTFVDHMASTIDAVIS